MTRRRVWLLTLAELVVLVAVTSLVLRQVSPRRSAPTTSTSTTPRPARYPTRVPLPAELGAYLKFLREDAAAGCHARADSWVEVDEAGTVVDLLTKCRK